MMELNRNQFFMAGVLILLFGLQFRLVESVVLNEKTTQFLAQRMQNNQTASVNSFATAFAAAAPVAKKRLDPPRWLGYSLLSIGAVLTLHALALKKQG